MIWTNYREEKSDEATITDVILEFIGYYRRTNRGESPEYIILSPESKKDLLGDIDNLANLYENKVYEEPDTFDGIKIAIAKVDGPYLEIV